MKDIRPLDCFDKEIQVGDTVVYAVKTREGGLQKGEVVGLVPYFKDDRNANPFYERGGTEPRFLINKNQHYKIKVKTASSRYDYDEQKMLPFETTKTLDQPSRFAVVT